jgi:parvulin-like peptidyl-prolyl isomerase
VDRIAVVVGDRVITQSEVLRELRLTQLINGQALDLGAEQRRAAAERLVDQQLIRNEMEIGRYPQPSDAEAGAMVQKFRQERYRGLPQFRAALEKYGITEDELKQHLLWQLAALRFTDQRFHSAVPEPPTQSADRSGADPQTVDQQMEAWLKETRAGTRIQFKQGAFQ